MKLAHQVIIAAILPVLFSALLAVFFNIYYLKVLYPDWIQEKVNNMTDTQLSVLSEIGLHISNTTATFLERRINPILYTGQIISEYYAGSIQIKDSWNDQNNSVNAVYLAKTIASGAQVTDVPGWNLNLNQSFSFAMWFDHFTNVTVQSLQPVTRTNLRNAAVFDFVNQAILRLSPANQVYMAFDIDGLFYFMPAMYKSYYINPSVSSFNPNTCPYMNGVPQYEPRCRGWYIQTKAGTPMAASLVPPYLFAAANTVGQTTCVSYWNQTSLITMDCLDFLVSELSNRISSVQIGSTGYSYVLTPQTQVYLHRELNYSWTGTLPNITVLEYVDQTQSYPNSTSIFTAYNSTLLSSQNLVDIHNFETLFLPLFNQKVSARSNYTRFGVN